MEQRPISVHFFKTTIKTYILYPWISSSSLNATIFYYTQIIMAFRQSRTVCIAFALSQTCTHLASFRLWPGRSRTDSLGVQDCRLGALTSSSCFDVEKTNECHYCWMNLKSFDLTVYGRRPCGILSSEVVQQGVEARVGRRHAQRDDQNFHKELNDRAALI